MWCWDNLNIHFAPELAEFATEDKDWLRIYRLPAYAPDLNPEHLGQDFGRARWAMPRRSWR